MLFTLRSSTHHTNLPALLASPTMYDHVEPLEVFGIPAVPVRIAVDNAYAAVIKFAVLGLKPYTFHVAKWTRKGMPKFMRLFYEASARDEAVYGRCGFDDDGNAITTNAQKVAAVVQACRDIVACLSHCWDTVYDCETYAHANAEEATTYGDYIIAVTCRCVAHCKSLSRSLSRMNCLEATF